MDEDVVEVLAGERTAGLRHLRDERGVLGLRPAQQGEVRRWCRRGGQLGAEERFGRDVGAVQVMRP
ncbi:hypothetical protein [Lentzea guizhouensis]|uniref:hypothetical protein n=1 Tax=Lentzea guizhouensis TaxID=1586287 RepID=UPI0012B68EF3|nr:hypothetical protein [Lentzea guizhouensis]